MSITFGGLASGLDTNSIISQLVALERRPITILQAQKGEQQAKLDLMGTFEKLVKDLQMKAKDLAGGDFFAYDLQVGTEGVADFNLTGDAPAAAHTLQVFSLAAADRYSYDGVTDPTVDLGAGTIEFDYYDDATQSIVSHTVTVAAGAASLNDISDSINAQVGEQVSASVINTGTAATPSYELVITSDKSGEDYAIQALDVNGIDLTGQTQIAVATNAHVKIDGLDVERSNNLFSDVLEGVSFTVTQADPSPEGAQTTFTIEANSAGMQENLEELVSSYNAVIDFINAQEEYSEEGGAGGLLFGDSALRRVRSTIQGAMFNLSPAELGELVDPLQNDGFVALSQIGLSFDVDGRLELDTTKVGEKLSENLTRFAELLINDDGDGVISDADGALVKLDQAIESLIKDSIALDGLGNPIIVDGKELQVDGLFNLRRDTFQTIIGNIDKEVERMEFRLEKFEESLVLQYSRLEQLIGRLNSQSSFLNSAGAFPSLSQ